MEPIFIVAASAGGASELAAILNGNGLACLPTAFEIDNRYSYAFGQFLRRANVGAVELIATPDQVLDDYLSHCATLVKAERFALEMRHHSMSVFNGCAWQLGHRPRLVTYLRRRRFRVVHVHRRNLVEHCVRLQMPQTGGGGKAAPFALNLKRCERDLNLLDQVSKWMATWFDGYDRYHELACEAVFEAGAVSDTGARLLERVFDITVANRTPTLPLANDDFSHLLDNASEVMAALADGPHAGEAAALFGGGASS